MISWFVNRQSKPKREANSSGEKTGGQGDPTTTRGDPAPAREPQGTTGGAKAARKTRKQGGEPPKGEGGKKAGPPRQTKPEQEGKTKNGRKTGGRHNTSRFRSSPSNQTPPSKGGKGVKTKSRRGRYSLLPRHAQKRGDPPLLPIPKKRKPGNKARTTKMQSDPYLYEDARPGLKVKRAKKKDIPKRKEPAFSTESRPRSPKQLCQGTQGKRNLTLAKLRQTPKVLPPMGKKTVGVYRRRWRFWKKKGKPRDQGMFGKKKKTKSALTTGKKKTAPTSGK